MLNRVFSEFDKLSVKYGVEKIKTIGDAYMAVSGVPNSRTANHAVPLAGMAVEMIAAVQRVGEGLSVRIGLHSGEVVAGVIGTSKFSYDLWGDTVNTAARLESHGEPGRIHCSEEFLLLVKDLYEFDDRGLIDVKGKGKIHTYFLGDQRLEFSRTASAAKG